ncbi:MAG TPA: hypothetical protein VK488_05250 [Gaiellaceae bacterium]|nr:hypothetical protein [Gaiellaceae bacterium]
MRRLALIVALGLASAGTASAKLAVPGVQDGMLAVSPGGTPLIAYLDGNSLEIAARSPGAGWRPVRAASVTPGSSLAAFAAGRRGPVAVIEGPGSRSLVAVRRGKGGWRTTRVAAVPAGDELGWPGLVLHRGLPAVAYTRWRRSTRESVLKLARIDRHGRVRSTRITRKGFPPSFVPPSSVPVRVHGEIHVIQSYGIDGVVGTIEWYPNKRSWTGQFIDAGGGDFPVGRLLGAVGGGTVYAAWSEAFLGLGEQPVTLAVHGHGRSIDSDFVLDRAVTTGLDVARSGPEVAANEWVSADELGLSGPDVVWAGVIVAHGRSVGLDGRIAGLSSAPHGAHDLLLANPDGLSWYRSRRARSVWMSIDATAQLDGSVVVTGRVRGASAGTVTLYRERPGTAREPVGTAPLAGDGSFMLLDRPTMGPFLYRAVYVDGATGVPYSALLRDVVG